MHCHFERIAADFSKITSMSNNTKKTMSPCSTSTRCGASAGKRTLLAVTVSLAMTSLIASPSAIAMNLIQALEAALQNDQTYQSAIHENAAAGRASAIARAALLPNIGMSFNLSKNMAERTITNAGRISRDSPDYVSNVATLSLRQPLYNADAEARFRQSSAQTDYSEAVFVGRTQELISRLFAAYVDTLFAQDQIRLATAQRNALKENQTTNQRKFEKGEGTKTDVLETQARFELAQAQLLEAEDNVETMRRKLMTITGPFNTPIDSLEAYTEFFSLTPDDYPEWEELALRTNAEIVSQRYLVTSAEQEIKRAEAGHLPRVDLVASLNKSSSDSLFTYNQESTTRSIGVQMTLPIYSGGGVNATVLQALSNLDRAKADLAAKINKVLVELRKQHRLVSTTQSRIIALAKAEQSALQVIDATKKSVTAGIRVNLDLLNAEQQLFTTRRDLAQARYSYLTAYLQLRYAAGVLNGEDLQRVGAYFKSAP